MAYRNVRRDDPPLREDAFFGDFADEPIEGVTADDLEAMCASSTYSCFELGYPVHCELPPDDRGFWPFPRSPERLPYEEFPFLRRTRGAGRWVDKMAAKQAAKQARRRAA